MILLDVGQNALTRWGSIFVNVFKFYLGPLLFRKRRVHQQRVRGIFDHGVSKRYVVLKPVGLERRLFRRTR